MFLKVEPMRADLTEFQGTRLHKDWLGINVKVIPMLADMTGLLGLDNLKH